VLTIQRSTLSCAAALNPHVPETKAAALTAEKRPFDRRLHRDADRNSDVGIPAVEQVIAVVDVGHVNIVGVVPIVRPVLWPRVNSAEPIALVLEARIPTNYQQGQTVNSEPVVRAKVASIAIVRNAIPVVSTSLLPIAVV